MPSNLEEKFNLYCNLENLEINYNQLLVIQKLQDFYKKNFYSSFFNFLFKKENSKKSFYLYGGVGVGKTMILDFFYNQIKEKKTTYMRLSKNQLIENNYKKGDTEGLVNYGLSLKNIDFTAIFIEDIEEMDNVKISFRSKNIFPCDKFAKKFFNGGGHKNAAGGKYTGTIDDAVEKFKRSLTDFNF